MEDNINLNKEHIHILQHSLGVDKYGKGEQYRNRFITGPDGDDFKCCRELVENGFMGDHGPQEMMSGMHYFYVTKSGIEIMVKNSPKK